MKVLFVCHRVPFPPKRGGKIRPFNIIRHLTQQGHQVSVASLARDEEEADEAQGLREYCERTFVEVIPDLVAWPRMLAWVPSTQPSSFAYFYSPKLAGRIAAEIATDSYDLIFAHCSSVAPYITRAAAPRRGPALRVLDFGDMDSQKWREYVAYKRFPVSFAYWLEAAKMERAERRLADDFDLCTCTTVAELQSLRDLGAKSPTDWFPNGVDADFFVPSSDPYDPNVVAFVGRMDYYPNQLAVNEFCRDVLPRLQRSHPAVRFDIVGADPPDSIRALGRLPGVTVTGSVPDVRPFLRRAALTVAPLSIARGTQNKILESMALGVPVVCSVEASRGVDAVAGQHLLTATSSEEYVAAVGALLSSAALRDRFAQEGRQRMLSNHAWASSLRRLDGLLAGAFERHSGFLRAEAPLVT